MLPDLIETGLEPEFVITEIAQTEPVGEGPAVRVYFACQRHGAPVLQCTLVGSPADLIRMATEILAIAAGIADVLALRACLEAAKAH